MQKEAFEPTGLIPRSIIRTFDRFLQQLFPGSESVAVQEYRVSRYQILVSIQSFFILVFVPLFVNYAAKSFVLMPLIEHFWNSGKREIFLNVYQEKRAFAEMQDFSEKIFFESLLHESQSDLSFDCMQHKLSTTSQAQGGGAIEKALAVQPIYVSNRRGYNNRLTDQAYTSTLSLEQEAAFNTRSVWHKRGWVDQFNTNKPAPPESLSDNRANSLLLFLPPPQGQTISILSKEPYCQSQAFKEERDLQNMFQLKNLQIANRYKKENVLAIANIFADSLTLCTLYVLSVLMKAQIIILKSFLIESIYSLSDTTKSFLLILIMDLLVGFHSLHAWEIVFAGVFQHFGLPENENCILICVALFPVCLDTVFKYWIFRYLNKISPSTVVTYHSMLE